MRATFGGATPLPRGAQYAISPDGVRIAFVAVGQGDPVVWIPHHFASHVELEWEVPQCEIYRSLAERCMVVRFDCRGLGLSDRDGIRDLSLEARMHDLEAVVDKLQLDRFALAGLQGGGNLAVAYAASRPERVTRLVLLNWTPNFAADADRPRMATLRRLLEKDWEVFTENVGSVTWGYHSPYAVEYGRLVRASLTQKMAVRYGLELVQEDCTPLLPLVQAPTLILHSERSAYASPAGAKRASASIPHGRLREFEGELTDHVERVVEAMGAFLAPDRATAPVGTAAAGQTGTLSTAPAGQDAGLLTPRELEVMHLLVSGCTNREIAARLSLSPRTIERHLENLYRKTGARNRAEAVAHAAALGLVERRPTPEPRA